MKIQTVDDIRKLLECESETILCDESIILTNPSNEKMVIDGKGKTLKGNGKGHGIEIHGSHIEICNLKISGYFAGIWIEALDESISDISVHDCIFEDIESEGLSTVIRRDGLSISDISVCGNIFYAPTKNRNGHCSTAINFMTGAFSDNTHPIHNVKLSNVECRKNQILKNPEDGNPFMLGVTVHGNSAYAFYDNGDMLNAAYNDASDSLEENIRICENIFNGVWDISIDVLAGFPGIGKSRLRNVEISGNIITYHNTAINLGSSNIPCNGKVSDCISEDVLITRNTLIPNVPGPDEPQIGIMLFAIRAESRMIECHDCHMRNIRVINNDIIGREIGIALQAVHATQDLPHPSHLYDVTLTDVEIADNRIINASLPVRIFAAHLEGRYDPFWGFELAPFDEKLPYSTWCENAQIDHVAIHNNFINTYDIACTLGAAWGGGHSFIERCTIGQNILFEHNDLRSDHKVFCYGKNVMDNLMYDDAKGSQNKVLCNLKIR